MTPLPPFPEHLETADIDWRDGSPVSRRFADIYFSDAGGIAETTHVFIANNDLPARFRAGKFHHFTIAETGFGTGLNFLVAAQTFLACAPAGTILHFVSTEKFPLTADDMQRAHAHWPTLAVIADELRTELPPACTGFHRRSLCGGRIRLTLLLGDATVLLPRLNARVDAWFLDGFSPAKNEDLWTTGLFREIARLSAADASFATFTAAGHVKRGMIAAGFAVEKVAGCGSKRDMLRGRRQMAAAENASTTKRRTAAVIGGGLAGCATARALAERGWQVTVFERNATPASETSGNLAGAVYPKFSPHETAQNRWYRDSYLFALARLPQILGTADHQSWAHCGLLQLMTEKKQDEIISSGRWPPDVVRSMSAHESPHATGLPLKASGLWFAGAAWVHPPALCAALIDHPHITFRGNTAANAITRQNETMSVDGEIFSIAVIANALAASQFAQTSSLPLRRVRGQVTHVVATDASQKLHAIVCHEGYVTPARNGLHCVGATFAPRDADNSVRADDHAENLSVLAEACPALYDALGAGQCRIDGGRTGFRTQTPDYLPVIGAVADADSLPGQTVTDQPARIPGLFVLSALGAKGIAFSLLGAEILAAQINNEPMPVDSEVTAAIDPARFLLRAQRRRQNRSV